jgi:hypothetical protein
VFSLVLRNQGHVTARPQAQCSPRTCLARFVRLRIQLLGLLKFPRFWILDYGVLVSCLFLAPDRKVIATFVMDA